MPTSSSDVGLPFQVRRAQGHRVVTFRAMACPCEIHMRTESARDAQRLASLACTETARIEQKFSRYRNDNIVWAINNAHGRPVTIDAETLQLLHFAGQCHALSGGLFDITSGILRQAWRFDGTEVRPDEHQIASLLSLVGWDRVHIEADQITLVPGMEIDLGGVGKEYAVDRVAQLLADACDCGIMVNFGGDIRIPGPAPDRQPWHIGLADPQTSAEPVGVTELLVGAVTTSGVSYRHCFVNGKRLGHILNPRTGWPVEGAPRSVTVIADYCLEAGMLSTLAMLHGDRAEAFLADQSATSHCVW